MTETTNKPLVYLACPYSHADEHVREYRYLTANRVAADLTSRGLCVFSPITHSHPLPDLPSDWDFWKKIDFKFLSVSNELYVIQIAGWEESIGVQAEIKEAQRLGIPVWPIALEGQ